MIKQLLSVLSISALVVLTSCDWSCSSKQCTSGSCSTVGHNHAVHAPADATNATENVDAEHAELPAAAQEEMPVK